MSQSSKNPFDLQYKTTNNTSDIPTILPDSQAQTNSKVLTEEKPSNPFDIVNSPPKVEKKITPTTTKPLEHADKRHETVETKSFLFWVFLGLLLIFSSIFSMSKKSLGQIVNSFRNENFLRQTHRLNQGNFSIAYLILYLLAFISIGIFIYLITGYLGVNTPQNFLFLLKIIGVVIMAFLGKHLLLSIVGYIFPVQKEISLYSYVVMVFSILIGLFLLVMNVLIAYIPPVLGKPLVYLALGAILAIYLYRIIRGLSIGSKYLVSHKFHFFIYLCSVEILPVIVLIKLISNYSGGFSI